MVEGTTSASTRARAAESVLTHAAKAIELEDIEARVAELAGGRGFEIDGRTMKTIHRRLRKLEEGLGLGPETEDEKRLRARLEAGLARLVAAGYQVKESDESELRGMTIIEILHRGRDRARLQAEAAEKSGISE